MKPLQLAVVLLALVALLAGHGPAGVGHALTVNNADGDACSAGEEAGLDAGRGGRRNDTNPWDFYDVNDDALINVFDDIIAVAGAFGDSTGPNYSPAKDRSPPPPPGKDPADPDNNEPWDLGPPDGSINVFDDILGVAAQFGHDCTGPEVAGTWSTGATMPTPRTEVASAHLGGLIYVIGGFPAAGGHTDKVEAYDIAANSWSTKAPLPQALHHAHAAAVNGRVYVVGGYSSGFSTISSATYEYNPGTNTWATQAPMPLPRAAGTALAVDGKIYVMGGVGPQSTVPLVYDPVANAWAQLAPMSAAREHLTAAVVDGKIYVMGGRQLVVQNVNTAAVYDPVANSWQSLAPLPFPRGGLASGALAGRVHVVGGEDLSPGGSTFPQHDVYDPASNTWRPAPPLPTSRHGLAAQVVGGKLYVLAGGPTPGLSVSGAVEVFELKP